MYISLTLEKFKQVLKFFFSAFPQTTEDFFHRRKTWKHTSTNRGDGRAVPCKGMSWHVVSCAGKEVVDA